MNSFKYTQRLTLPARRLTALLTEAAALLALFRRGLAPTLFVLSMITLTPGIMSLKDQQQLDLVHVQKCALSRGHPYIPIID